MEQVKLKGGQIYVTLKRHMVLKVTQGTLLIYLAALDSANLPGKRHFIKELNSLGENPVIPSFFLDDMELGKWSFVVSALGEAIIDMEDILSQEKEDELILSFAKDIDLKILNREDFETELVERIERQLVSEELYIYRNRQEQEKEFKRGIDSIVEVFTGGNRLAEGMTQSSLYNCVELICKRNHIYLCPYDTAAEACGKKFSLEEIARLSHFIIREVRLEENWYKKDCGSLIVYKQDAEEEYCIPVACIPKGPKEYTEYNFSEGTARKITAEASRDYVKTAYMIYKPFPARELTNKDLFKYCKESVYKEDVTAIFIFSLLIMLIGLWLPVMTQLIYDKFILWGNKQALLLIGLVAMAFTIGNLLFSVVKKMVVYRSCNRIEMNLQSAMFDRLFNMEEKMYGSYESSDLVRRAFSISEIISGVFENVIVTLITNSFSVIYLIMMFLYSKTLTAVGLVLFLLNLSFNLVFGSMKGRYEKSIIELRTKASSIMYQAIMGIAKIKIAGAGNRILLKYLEPNIEAKKVMAKRESLNYGSGILNVFFTVINTVVFYFALVNFKLGLSIGQFLAFNAAFSLFLLSMQQLSLTYFKIKQLQPLYSKLKVFFDTPPETQEGSQTISSLEGKIEVNNVSFRYNAEEGMVISGLSLTIHKGEYIGIVGSSGSGKSTLLKLLLGFEKATSGKIYYDDKDIDSLDKRELRKCLGVVIQDGQLIAGSIYENIVIASTAVTNQEHKREIEKVYEIIRLVGLAEDIKQMPMGIETVIAEGAGTISGGQRQRILIARAIFHNPRVIYFDEATSALDNVNQALVSDNLSRLKATRVVIAHRLSTIMDCDRILVMEKGKITEEGTYEELMARKGIFYEMSLRQTA